jgi:hypothetical protein
LAFFTARAGLAIGVGGRLAAARLGGVERFWLAVLDVGLATRGFAFFDAFFAARLGAFRVVFAGLLDARFWREERVDDGLAERRAAARGELRFGRLALLPVGRFLAMAV